MERWVNSGMAARVCRPLCSGLILLLAGALPAPGSEPRFDFGPLDNALVLLKLDPRDLRVKSNYAEDQVGEGKLRLGIVTNGLRSAVGSAQVAHSLGYQLTDQSDPVRSFEALAGLLDTGPVRAEPPAGPLHQHAPLALALAEPEKREDIDPQGPAPEPIGRLPLELRQALAELVYGVARANTLLARTTRDLSADDVAAIRTGLPPVLLEQRPAAGTVLASLKVAARLNLRDIASAGATLAGSIGEARRRLAALPGAAQAADAAFLAEPTVFSQEMDFGDVVVAGTGGNTHRRTAAILIDLGGDDYYEMSELDDQPLPPVRVIVDLGGDDRYVPTGSFGPSAVMLGLSALVDEAGSDLYFAKDPFSFGAAICGVGLLVDNAGDDQYIGDVFSQGAAMFGVGLLVDVAGDDTYNAELSAQGFGCVKGIGALIDLAGNDDYRAGHRYAVTQQGEDRMLAFSQGFGLGLRPFASGGMGILADADGADIYGAHMLCQGAAWWYGAGLLFDRAGDDAYQGNQYAQGSAGFLSVAHLLDEAGNDRYVAQELSQGYARDRAIGILRDVAGNDSYVAEQMAHGAAVANGIAIAADLQGDDMYASRSDSLGHAPSAQGSTTIGLFSDGGGTDWYAHTGSDNLCWLGEGLAAGIDLGSDLSQVRAIIPLTSGRITSSTSLPLAPTSGPPIAVDVDEAELGDLWKQVLADDPLDRRQAIRVLVGLGEKAVPYLIARLQASDSDLNETAQKLLVQIGPPAVPELLRLVEDAHPAYARAAMVVLGKIGDPRAATPLAQKAKSPQWRTRAAAAAAMGAFSGEDTRLALEQLLRDEDEDVRRSALVALRYRGEADSADAISDLLGDPVFANRFAAADALVGLGVPCPPHVLSLVGSDQREVKHLSLETCGRLVSRQSGDMLVNLLASQDWGDRAFAAEALCRIGDKTACEKLVAMLQQENNGLVKAKAEGAMRAYRFCLPQKAGGK